MAQRALLHPNAVLPTARGAGPAGHVTGHEGPPHLFRVK